MQTNRETSVQRVVRTRPRAVGGTLYALAGALVALSAVAAKEARIGLGGPPALTRVERVGDLLQASYTLPEPRVTPAPEPVVDTTQAPEPAVDDQSPQTEEQPEPAPTRWFDARPVRESRVIWMTVTAYSPDERSCGIYADGQTATLHGVNTNAMQLVAADPTVLPYGTMLTIPGYAGDSIVPVLDCGGAIKGDRLDLLMPTHEIALEWGVQRVPVTVWTYADGKPAPNPREVR